MDSLVSTDWLAHRLGADGLVILDASKHLPEEGRDARGEFASGHIPGARFLDMPSLHDPEAAVVNTLPPPALLAERLAALGVTPASRIVLYDDSRIRSAARAWFILREAGFGNVAVLDGGLEKWRREGRALESGLPDQASAAPHALREPARVASLGELLGPDGRPARQIVDARDRERFEDGHIPGSRHLWFTDLFAADGTYNPAAALRAQFESAGLDLSRPVVTSCNSGMTACVLLFALHLAGAQDAALYDGSWQEWGNDPATPKATGGPERA